MTSSIRPPGPLAGVTSLWATMRTSALPAYAPGFDDADYARGRERLADEPEPYREGVRQGLERVIPLVVADSGEEQEVRELVATLPAEILDYLASLALALEFGAERRGLPVSSWSDNTLTEAQRARIAEGLAAHDGQVQQHFDAVRGAVVGLVHVPGMNWLFGAGIHVLRALLYAVFWLASKVRLGLAIVFLPLWIIAASLDFVTFSLPWVVFALASRLVRGQDAGDRSFDRWLGCWVFGSSLRARMDYGSLKRFKSHRGLLDSHILLLPIASEAVQIAVTAQVLGCAPKTVERAPRLVGTQLARWWAPRAATAVYFVVLGIAAGRQMSGH